MSDVKKTASEPSRATLAAVHRVEMRRAQALLGYKPGEPLLRLSDGKDLTEIRLGEAAHYETKTASEAVINYVMKVLRRDFISYDQSKLLGSDEPGAVPMVSLWRIVKEAKEAVYG